MGLVPERLVDYVGPFDWFIGADPVYAGLTRYSVMADGRSYRSTAHVLWPVHLRHLPATERVPTIVLPEPGGLPYIVVHEFGHIFDCRLRFAWQADVTTPYSRTDRAEAFAESFAHWCFGLEISERDAVFLEQFA